MCRIMLLTMLFTVVAMNTEIILAESFKSVPARTAKANFVRKTKELAKEFDLRRKELQEKYADELKQARAEALEKGDLEEAQRILAAEKIKPAGEGNPQSDSQVLSIWNLSRSNGDQSLYVFRSDGKLITAWNTCEWQIKGDILTWQCPAPDAPGGSWNHQFTLSKDRKTIEGKNQIDTKFTGKLILGSF